ncbi:hypothetical protein KL86DYS2_20049 [uncultured Dysgonomonas sp.]|uniref:Uncharacterized protein n=1 Tax=uncultured Dysgonomonas sp. TaxID=206096 RepID=A0A212KF41_9BACT|nr:hypothetical protein KL86DYS2_20049 [uncultured Dysgonomonas sp.]
MRELFGKIYNRITNYDTETIIYTTIGGLKNSVRFFSHESERKKRNKRP